jgi:alpha-L-fucosidase
MAESWGYSTLDTAPFWKSSTQLIRHLVDISSKGGNYLLNIGPDATGAIPGPARERLAALAVWMAVNAESIHGAGASTLPPPDWGRFTQRGNTVYAHLFEPPAPDLVLPIDPRYIQSIEMLTATGAQPLAYGPTHGAAVLVALPAAAQAGLVPVLRIQLTAAGPRAPAR